MAGYTTAGDCPIGCLVANPMDTMFELAFMGSGLVLLMKCAVEATKTVTRPLVLAWQGGHDAMSDGDLDDSEAFTAGSFHHQQRRHDGARRRRCL